MDSAQSRSLIRDTLTKPFDKGRFQHFIRNLLNHIDESKAKPWNKTYVKDAFKPRVNRFERLATYTDPKDEKLDILIVHLERDSSLERARTSLRNFVADYLSTRGGKEAALVAFVSPDEADWRFSFVKMEYESAADESGKIRVSETLTPARRYSFLVGANEHSHTAQKQFLPLLEKDEGNPTLANIEAAFDIEKVTKEFFQQYKKLFENVRDGLDKILKRRKAVEDDFVSKGIEVDDFAKKLLGQIVFLYFLQKKGWFGVERGSEWGTGNKHFLRYLFENLAKLRARQGRSTNRPVNFFNDVLEHLFYDALARERDDDYYARFDCRIPFLNGGLFEPLFGYDWVNTEILLPDDLFSNNQFTKEGDTGTGILDVFDRFNFTVNEAEPLEKEVAVDPEMLGKVFENLLPENLRYKGGTYYTPRVIVNYMCQQSLINYLSTHLPGIARDDIDTFIRIGYAQADFEAVGTLAHKNKFLHDAISQNAKVIDKLLEEITVCDPAIGSGAFPVGMMQEIVRARQALAAVQGMPEQRAYDLKRHAIQNCLYGVDIDPGAVEIAKLRLWLSLVVDEEDRSRIRALPNLDYKIMQGNSLLDEFHGVKLLDDDFIEKNSDGDTQSLQELKAQIRSMRDDAIKLRQAHGAKSPQAIKHEQRIDKLLNQVGVLVAQPQSQNEDLFAVESKRKLEILKQRQREFFDETSPNKKKRLREQIELLEWDFMETKLKESGSTEALRELSRHRRDNRRNFFLWKLHFAEVFQTKGGFDIVLANPPYVFARDSIQKGLTQADKDYFYAHYELAEYQVNLYPLFIERGTAYLKPHGVLCFITPNNWLTINTNKSLRKFVLLKSDIVIVNFYARVFESAAVDSAIVIYAKSNDSPRATLYEYVHGFVLIKEAPTEWFLKKKGYVINIDSFKGSDLTQQLLHKIESRSIPLSSIADVKAALMAYEVGKGKPAQTAEMKDKRVYHSKRKIDETYIKYLDGKDVCRYRLDWSGEYLKYGENLAAPRKDFRMYSTKRILVRQIPAKPPYCIHACLTKEKLLNDRNSMNIINIKEAPESVLGVLNSKLVSFWFVHKFGKMQRETFPQFKVNELAEFPIPKNLQSDGKKIGELSLRILAAKGNDPQADASKLECEIDSLVYKLYELTDDEIAIVEGKS